MSAAQSPPSTVRRRVERSQCADVKTALRTEWLETDGCGGYASNTILFCATRRYHGLLVSSFPGNPKRHVLLSRFEETLVVGSERLPISTADYGEELAPEGHLGLESFELVPYPRSTYAVGPYEVVREVLLVEGEPTVLCRYTVRGLAGARAELELRPLLPFREADALTSENAELDTSTEILEDGIRCRPYDGLPTLAVSFGATPHRFAPDPVWYWGLRLAEEKRRGYPDREDQFSPGLVRLAISEDEPVVVAASLEQPVADPAGLWKAESERREARMHEAGDSTRGALDLGADHFLYTDGERWGVQAGFPWFVEWGRDTFIALPGLTLARRQPKVCQRVLEGALPYLEGGLLPNIFGPDKETSHYGSADAALWFARAVQLFERSAGSPASTEKKFRPALESIAEAYFAGTKLGLSVDADGLLHAGSEELNATWMDAQTSRGPVTPRHGFAVELCALWYSLLAHLEELAEAAGRTRARERWGAARQRAGAAFLERFWITEERYLADTWLDGKADGRVRPNMAIAAALELSPLSRAQRAGVVARIERELLTPVGLRTLAPSDSEYIGTYGGDPDERDGAYHQGTVWPWLLGFYCEAALRSAGAEPKALRTNLRTRLDAFGGELSKRGLLGVSEVFDGDAPHAGGGTIAQAWSSAELLRAYALLDDGVAATEAPTHVIEPQQAAPPAKSKKKSSGKSKRKGGSRRKRP